MGFFLNIFNKKNSKFSDINTEKYQEENFKKNIFIGIAIIFFIIFFLTLYILIRNEVLNFDKREEEKEKEKDLLKIIIPYPNSVLNIDDYKILKYEIKYGDNLLSILINQIGASIQDAKSIISAMQKYINPSQLKVRQILSIKYKTIIGQNQNGELEENNIIEELKVESENEKKEIIVSLDKNNKYIASINEIVYSKSFVKYKVKITDSFYNDGIRAGISPNTMLNLIKFFSFDIDFQRDVRKNDNFEILFEVFLKEDGKKVKDGDIIYASIENSNKKFEIYRYNVNGIITYFDKDGQGVQKSLLKTPINGARISSPYGVRKHPILGYTKMHNGKDFAAPVGTPIFAAGSGTIVKAQYWSTWGNYIRIKHQGGYDTEYAHASRIANGIRPGVRVRQGDIIAYVGSTGRSTGPHLHYGVFYQDKRINPDRVKSFPSIKLIGKDLINFKREVERINLYRNNLSNQNVKLRK